MNKMAAKKDSQAVRVLCEVLVDGVKYAPDSVVTFPAGVFAQLKEFGSVDESKCAVDYCASIGIKPIEHEAV